MSVATSIAFEIGPQPDGETCGPTCLHSVYRYFGNSIPLEQVIREVPRLEEGGTLGVYLGSHALRLGYQVTIYTYNVQVFDPTWFSPGGKGAAAGLDQQVRIRKDKKLLRASQAYREFLALGGELRFEDLTPALLRRYLTQSIPILTGLSATYLYQCAREYGTRYDDLRGRPTGHFVVLVGYGRDCGSVLVADPLLPNPFSSTQYYSVDLHRAISAILLGVITYDANLLIVRPARWNGAQASLYEDADRRQ